MASSLTGKMRDLGELVKFSHTVFLMPFALSAVALAHLAAPVTWLKLFWILVALVSARTAAMVMNRIADLKFDAENPRTQNRPMVTGRVSGFQAWLYLILSCLALVLAAWQLNPLCLMLSPLGLFWILFYSFTKRFTMLCHIWLGIACALAPVGAWIAVTGSFDWSILVLAVSVICWVAGFDVIYACQDIGFDREAGLSSMPARLGLSRALWVSRGLHVICLLGFFWLAWLFGLGKVYLAGMGVITLALIAEHALVAVKHANIPMVFFTVNGIVSLSFFGFVLADILTGGSL